MTGSPGLLTTIFAFVLVLGPLVLVHELGHYLVARFFGLKAEAFSIGFGKELVGWTDRRGTRWKLSALPLGGYVQFAGDADAMSRPDQGAATATDEQRRTMLQFRPLHERAAVVLAGPLTNLIVAVLVFAAFFMAYGKPVAEPVVADRMDGFGAVTAGIEPGDRIVAIDGEEVESIADLDTLVRPYPGERVSVTVERKGRQTDVPVTFGSYELVDRFGNRGRIGVLGLNFLVPEVGRVVEGSAAAAAGVRAGDRIVAIDGEAVRSFDQVPARILPHPGKRIVLTVRRGGDDLTLPLTIGAVEREDREGRLRRVGQIGIEASVGRTEPVGPLRAVVLGAEQSVTIMRMMVAGVVQIVTGARPVSELGGPIKIAKYSGEQFSLGWEDFASFVAMISINLAFINLLPIPGLDGGHLAFYAAEAVRRRPLGLRSQEWAMRTGVALVLALMLVVTVNDLASLPIFGG